MDYLDYELSFEINQKCVGGYQIFNQTNFPDLALRNLQY